MEGESTALVGLEERAYTLVGRPPKLEQMSVHRLHPLAERGYHSNVCRLKASSMQSCTWTSCCDETVRPSALPKWRSSVTLTFFRSGLSTIVPSRRWQLLPHGCCTKACSPAAAAPSTFLSSEQKITRPPTRNGSVEQASSPTSMDIDLNQVLSTRPSIATLASLLRHCGSSKALLDGKLVHQHINRHGYHRNTYISNCLVLMYADCESMEDAQKAFDKISRPNSFSWSILIKAYAQNGKLDEARSVFSRIPRPDVVSWNTMIAAYAQKQQGKEALDLFWKMQQDGFEPNNITFLCTLEACSNLRTLEEVQEFLTAISGSKYAEDILVKTALVGLHGKCGRLDDAWSIFDKMPHRDVVSWNAMIAAYAQNGHGKKALDLFRQLQQQGMKLTSISFVCVLDACASLLALEEGLRVHAGSVYNAYERDLAVGNALINMYGKCGCLHEARDSFGRISQHNVVSWTALMTACVDGNQDEEALRVFCQMQLQGLSPNKVTFVCALDACASLAALEEGLLIHAAVVNNALEQDVVVGTALIHMYGKCGFVQNARSVFKRIFQQDAASWNAMLTACAQNGHGEETLDLFYQMHTTGFRPNNVSFTCVLTVCSHMGWVDDGRRHFMSIYRDYNIRPTMEHCACMIDLLGRAGCLEEAEDLVDSMPVGKLASVWTSLLAACRIHGDVQRGSRVADHFSELDPIDPAPYVMLANICAAGDG